MGCVVVVNIGTNHVAMAGADLDLERLDVDIDHFISPLTHGTGDVTANSLSVSC
jgi:hypothetical protein